MPERGRGAIQDDEPYDNINMRRLWRLAFWGGAAALTLTVAVFAGRSEIGSHRVQMAMGRVAAPTARPTMAQAKASFDAQAETRRLSEKVRALAADRDRLQMRLASLEHNLEDVTGSVKREISAVRAAAAAKPAAPPQVAPVASAPAAPIPAPSAMPAIATAASPSPQAKSPAPAPGSEPVLTARSAGAAMASIPLASIPLAPLQAAPPQSAPKMPPAAASTANRALFGVDIGSAATVELLRAHWQMIRRAHPKLLVGLRPIVSIRDVAKRRAVELRLVAGPLNDASTAAKLCAALVSAGLRSCHTSTFEGQRLAIR